MWSRQIMIKIECLITEECGSGEKADSKLRVFTPTLEGQSLKQVEKQIISVADKTR